MTTTTLRAVLAATGLALLAGCTTTSLETKAQLPPPLGPRRGYLISKPHARGGYAAGKGRCLVFNFSGSFLHRTCIPVNIRISTPGMF